MELDHVDLRSVMKAVAGNRALLERIERRMDDLEGLIRGALVGGRGGTRKRDKAISDALLQLLPVVSEAESLKRSRDQLKEKEKLRKKARDSETASLQPKMHVGQKDLNEELRNVKCVAEVEDYSGASNSNSTIGIHSGNGKADVELFTSEVSPIPDVPQDPYMESGGSISGQEDLEMPEIEMVNCKVEPDDSLPVEDGPDEYSTNSGKDLVSQVDKNNFSKVHGLATTSNQTTNLAKTSLAMPREEEMEIVLVASTSTTETQDPLANLSAGNTVTCPICKQAFYSVSQLREHATVHTKKKTAICELCGKVFLQHSALVAHMRIHSGKKSFTCNICDKSYCSRTNLQAHKMSHTADKPVTCKVCNLMFPTLTALCLHAKVHAGNT